LLNPVIRDAFIWSGLFHPLRNFFYRDLALRDRSQRAFYANLIDSDDLVFDVGANIGQRTAIFASLSSRVVAFEPDPRPLKHLTSRFRFSPKVRIEPIALGEEEERNVALYCCDTHALSSLSPEHVKRVQAAYFPDDEWSPTQRIEVSTLDHMIDKYGPPAFTKIDVEGFEPKVLGGLSTPLPSLSFEWNAASTDNVLRCMDHLGKLGDYKYNYCLGEELDFCLVQHVSRSTFEKLLDDITVNIELWGDVYAAL
jgi:FkbM family methyltransferase